MRLFHRTTLSPEEILDYADTFFAALALSRGSNEQRSRAYSGALGNLTLSVRMEGGHYTFIEVATDQIGESRLDKNVKKFFVAVHRRAEPSHRVEAGY